MWPTLFTIAAVLCVLLLLAVVWLWSQRQGLLRRESQLSTELDEAERQAASLRDELRQRDVEIAKARAQLEGLGDRFKALANDVLKQSNEQLLQLAKEVFDGKQKDATAQLEQRKQAIEQMIKPIRESLDKHAKAVTDIEKQREGAYQSLRQQLSSMLEDQKSLQRETANLVKALRRPDVRGRWGEVQLKRVAELAGMVEHCDFVEQGTLGDGLRPDMRVHLPGGREIVVDAKTPIDAFLTAVEAEDETQREQELERHVRHITERINELSGKRYQDQVRSADFVVLFIPGESFLYAAANRRADLIEYAMSKGVVIATPTTLVALLKAVALGWREEKIAENARRISELGKELHERIAVALGHVEKLGKSLESSVQHYNKFVGSFESRVIASARKFKELGADSSKELPAEPTPQIEITPREVKQGISES
ncbi:MAG: DNA recombination protein RmuC [Phycisphaeraceae bacterium]